jgi:hypothetical protein
MSFFTNYTNVKADLITRSNEVEKSSEVTDRKRDKDSQAKAIIIFTPRKDVSSKKFSAGLSETCRSSGVDCEHVPVEARDLASKIKNFRDNGTIGDDTQIFLYLHGLLVKDKEGKVDLSLGERVLVQGNQASAIAVLEAIREPLEGSNEHCSASVYIVCCHAGTLAFAERVQELHNQHNAGVCFHLGSKSELTGPEAEAAMTKVSTGIISSKRAGGHAPTSEHVWALLTDQRADCMSMIVAKESYPRRIHRPRTGADAGGDAAIRRLDENALVFLPDNKFCVGLTAAQEGKFEKGPIPKANSKQHFISGGLNALTNHRAALGKLSEDEKTSGKDRNIRIARTSAARSDFSTMSKHILSSPEFNGLQKDEWNDSHDELLRLLCYIESGKSADYAEKIDYICKINYELFHQTEPIETNDLINEIYLTSPFAFEKMIENDFFVAPEGDIEDKISRITSFLAENTSLPRLKKMLDRVAHGANTGSATYGSIWKDRLVVGEEHACALARDLMLAAAANRNSEEANAITNYVVTLIKDGEGLDYFRKNAADLQRFSPEVFSKLGDL